jgi:hypothetical protein
MVCRQKTGGISFVSFAGQGLGFAARLSLAQHVAKRHQRSTDHLIDRWLAALGVPRKINAVGSCEIVLTPEKTASAARGEILSSRAFLSMPFYWPSPRKLFHGLRDDAVMASRI